ncbi:hypothetical protein [Solicola sp. PLA-1-18]|uniref:hypothetical protein n=1 Tax=Solicola sp. PLA-1-18 TaxID=3380532 RepID=UPI003B7EDD08
MPPYPMHDADVGTLEELSADLLGTRTTFTGVADDVVARAQGAATQAQGSIEQPVADVGTPAVATARDLGGAGLVASGCLTSWAGAVRTFESTVSGLNWRWFVAQSQGFGVADPEVPPGADAAERRGIEEGHQHAVSAARAELVRELDRLHTQAVDEVDRSGDDVARLLGAGPTDATIRTLYLDGALPGFVLVDYPGIELTDAELQQLRERLEREGRLDEFAAPPPLGTPSSEMGEQLDVLRRMGLEPTVFAELLRQYYVSKAAEDAGIDLTTWDVTNGAAAVSDHYEASYEYYAQLYLQNPYMRWAGMASMIGPSFAGGFEDIDMIRDLAQGVDGAFPDMPFPMSPGDVLPYGLDELAQMSDEELAFYQETFLTMQKDIFYDASMMHEAYLEGGLGSIEELQAAGLLDEGTANGDEAMQAWRDIDEGRRTGDTELINAGNEALLYREQRYTIADDYDAMRDHDPTGELFTYGLGLIGTPSIPGAESLGELHGADVDIDTSPLPGVQGGTVHTNIPTGNIADFDTRWDLIENDTLPAYLDLVENHPDQVEDILTTDVRDRIDDQRLSEQWDDILGTLTDVDVELRAW